MLLSNSHGIGLSSASAVTNLCLFILVISHPEISSSRIQPQDEDVISLDKLLRDNSKQGVFEADFESENGTTISVRDGRSVILNCKVYLIHDKTVSNISALSNTDVYDGKGCSEKWKQVEVKASGWWWWEWRVGKNTNSLGSDKKGRRIVPREIEGRLCVACLKWSLRGRFDRGH